MPRANQQPDLFSLFIDRLAAAVADRIQPSARASTKGASRKAPAPKAVGRRRKGQKRSASMISRTTDALLAYVKSHQGQRIEEIAKGMKESTKDLKLSAKKLIGDKKLKTKGQKRATKYY